MKKSIKAIVLLSLMTAVVLTGCGANKDSATQNTPPVTSTQANTTQSSSNKNSAEDSLKSGVAKLLHTAKQLRKAITTGDESNIKETGPKLEEAWSASEEGVKAKYPELYAQVEKYLDPTVAGSKASPLDKTALLKLDDQLIKVLYDLSEKLIPVEQVKAGVTQLLATTQELKQAIDAGDQVKVKEIGPKLEETWSTFEDGVKSRYPELYDKLEVSLNPEVAGSKASTLDKQTMGKLNEQLTQTLNELLQKL